MKKTVLKVLLILLSLLLVAEVAFVGVMIYRENNTFTQDPADTTADVPTTEVTEATTEAPATGPETTVAPTETEPAETEPKEIRYTLTFAGDCTLASDSGSYHSPAGFIQTIGTDYGFPFRNVLDYFENDDFTIINLESVLADEGYSSGKLFTFRGPTAYTEIMTGSSVEAVTLANNHTLDYGKTGYESTVNALTEAGIWFVEEDKTRLLTTESGLVIGLYADAFTLKTSDIEKNIAALKEQGAEVIICAFHWGNEGSYRPTADQKKFAKAAIDAGADIVYGHHPHVLQPIEEYNGGYIFYSLGNFSFGGNHFPRDLDSAVIQVDVLRLEDGSVCLDGMTIIPVAITSMEVQNNFQPTPYAEDSEAYKRTLSKLDGTFKGADLVVDYDHLKPTEAPTEPPAEVPTEGGSDVTEPEESGSDVPPPATGGDSGDTGDSGDSGSQTPPPAEGGEG